MEEFRKRLDRLATRKREEIADMERHLLEAKAFLLGIEESIKALPRDPSATLKILRQGSKIARTRDAIITAGKPLHIDEILKSLGEKLTPKAKMSLGGSLSTYVRRGEVFTRTGPNTFGLIEVPSGEKDSISARRADPAEEADDLGEDESEEEADDTTLGIDEDDEVPF